MLPQEDAPLILHVNVDSANKNSSDAIATYSNLLTDETFSWSTPTKRGHVVNFYPKRKTCDDRKGKRWGAPDRQSEIMRSLVYYMAISINDGIKWPLRGLQAFEE